MGKEKAARLGCRAAEGRTGWMLSRRDGRAGAGFPSHGGRP